MFKYVFRFHNNMSGKNELPPGPVPLKLTDLEKLLKFLPEPNCITVSLSGPFDYSSIEDEVSKYVSNAVIEQLPDKLTLQKVTKDDVLNIYRAMLQRFQVSSWKMPTDKKVVDLSEVGWYLDDAHIELHPTHRLDVWYNGREPQYITQIRTELAGTNFRIHININQRELK